MFFCFNKQPRFLRDQRYFKLFHYEIKAEKLFKFNLRFGLCLGPKQDLCVKDYFNLSRNQDKKIH